MLAQDATCTCLKDALTAQKYGIISSQDLEYNAERLLTRVARSDSSHMTAQALNPGYATSCRVCGLLFLLAWAFFLRVWAPFPLSMLSSRVYAGSHLSPSPLSWVIQKKDLEYNR